MLLPVIQGSTYAARVAPWMARNGRPKSHTQRRKALPSGLFEAAGQPKCDEITQICSELRNVQKSRVAACVIRHFCAELLRIPRIQIERRAVHTVPGGVGVPANGWHLPVGHQGRRDNGRKLGVR